MFRFRHLKLPQLNMKQISNLKLREKAKELGSQAGAGDIIDVIKWAEKNKKAPSDEDTAFCGDLEYSINDETKNLNNLRIFITTPRLIELTRFQSKHVATDGTYKLNYNGFPLLMIGTTDYKRRYHTYGIMLTKEEKDGDYEFMFLT